MKAALTIDGVTARPLTSADVPVLQALLDADRDFAEVTGNTVQAREMPDELPPGRSVADKFLFALADGDAVIGVIDLIRGYPEPQTWYLGLIFVGKTARNNGIGRRMLRALYPWIRVQGGSALRLGVVEGNLGARRLYVTEGFNFKAIREVDPAVQCMRRTLVLERAL